MSDPKSEYITERWEPEEPEPAPTPATMLLLGLIVDLLNAAAVQIENELENCGAPSEMRSTRNGEKVIYPCMGKVYNLLARLTHYMSKAR